jgi:hypothetical protein
MAYGPRHLIFILILPHFIVTANLFHIVCHIVAFGILFLVFAAVQVILVLRHWPVTGLCLILPVILRSASFHMFDFIQVLKNSYHFGIQLVPISWIFVLYMIFCWDENLHWQQCDPE